MDFSGIFGGDWNSGMMQGFKMAAMMEQQKMQQQQFKEQQQRNRLLNEERMLRLQAQRKQMEGRDRLVQRFMPQTTTKTETGQPMDYTDTGEQFPAWQDTTTTTQEPPLFTAISGMYGGDKAELVRQIMAADPDMGIKMLQGMKPEAMNEVGLLSLSANDPRRQNYVQGKADIAGARPQRPINVAPGGTVLDPNTLQPVYQSAFKPERPDRPTQYQTNNTSMTLRKEFNNRPEIKEYNQVQSKFGSLEKAFEESKKTGNWAATDQAMITLFNKITDPQSVVRESEYARMPQNLPFINAMKGKIEKVIKGGAGLTSNDRANIMILVRGMKQGYQELFDTTAKEYAEYSQGYGIDPSMVIGTSRTTTGKNARPGGRPPLSSFEK